MPKQTWRKMVVVSTVWLLFGWPFNTNRGPCTPKKGKLLLHVVRILEDRCRPHKSFCKACQLPELCWKKEPYNPLWEALCQIWCMSVFFSTTPIDQSQQLTPTHKKPRQKENQQAKVEKAVFTIQNSSEPTHIMLEKRF